MHLPLYCKLYLIPFSVSAKTAAAAADSWQLRSQIAEASSELCPVTAGARPKSPTGLIIEYY